MSDALAPDEKTCPFCAETIKKAAVKCRYCGSELPAEAPAPAPPPVADVADVADVAPPPEPVTEPERPAAPSQPLLASFRTTLTLLVVCVLLAVATGVVWWQGRPDEPDAKGPITSSAARDAGLQAASTLTQKVFSYNWTTFDKDAKNSEAVMSPSFRREYSSSLGKARAKAIANQVKQVAQASSSSVVTASPTRVEALVFLNIVTSGKTGTRNLTTSRLVVTLTRNQGEWRISNLDPI